MTTETISSLPATSNTRELSETERAKLRSILEGLIARVKAAGGTECTLSLHFFNEAGRLTWGQEMTLRDLDDEGHVAWLLECGIDGTVGADCVSVVGTAHYTFGPRIESERVALDTPRSWVADANAAWERAKADGYVPACFYGTPAEDDAPWDCD